MNHLWYEIKKLGFKQIDTKCNLCQGTLRRLKEYPLKDGEAIAIMPHVNPFGVITHYHIGRVDKKQLKETRIYKDLEETK